MPPVDTPATTRGLTVADIATRYRVGADRVRAWIRAGVLRAVNTADSACGKPRYVVPPDALAAFEAARAAAAPPKVRRTRRRPAGQIDYFPD